MKKYILLVLACVSILFVNAQEQTIDVENISKEEILKLDAEVLLELPIEQLMALAQKIGVSIDELLKMSSSVSSKTALTPREMPGIVSIITKEDIEKSGARDLVDILQYVPGISFGHDGSGILGITSRGNWGHEGKYLVLLDGQEMNEGLFSTTQFGNHISAQQIERIEIVRGPGSSLYGGYAELGVLNIITKSAKDLEGAEIYMGASSLDNKFAKKGATLNLGKSFNDLELSLTGNFKQGTRSFEKIKGFDETVYDLGNGSSDLTNYNLNFGAKYKALKTRFIFNDYQPKVEDDKGQLSMFRFRNFLGEIQYELKPNEKWTITPRLNYKNQTPYWLTAFSDKKIYTKYNGAVDFQYQLNKQIDIIGGVGFFSESGNIYTNTPENRFYNGKKELSFQTSNAYVQASYKTKFGNVFAGFRYDNHSKVGASISPRLGVTKAFEKFHYKLLYSEAFRAPSIENVNYNQSIKPEKTRAFELELGYILNDNMFLTSNIYQIKIKNPIVFYYEDAIDEMHYNNFDLTGSRGVEFEYLVKYKFWSMNLAYSYYTADGINKVDLYKVTDEKGSDVKSALKASPQHKFSVNSHFNLRSNIGLNLGYIYLGERYGFLKSGERQTKMNPTHLVNSYILFKNLGIKNLELGLGVNNILDEKYAYTQAYGEENRVGVSFPGSRREFRVQLKYRF